MGERLGWRDELRVLWLGCGDRAARGHRSRLPPLPLPGLRAAVQRAQRRHAEPDLPAQRRDRLRGVLPAALPADAARLSEVLALRGIEVSHEAVCDWETKLLPVMGDALRKRRHGMRRGPRASWHFDETYLKVRGRWAYLYRAIDRHGNLIDAMLSEHRDMKAAKAFFRSARATTGFRPDRVTTDGHGSYRRAIRSVLGKIVRHRTSAYLNNHLEQDHRGIKDRIRCTRGFKSHDAAHRFCREHGELRDLLRPRRRHNQFVSASSRRFRFARGARLALEIMQNA